MIKSIVIDTNPYSAYKRGETEALAVVKDAETIVFSPIVFAELIILRGVRIVEL
jgi:predicted nucleic acid-binding protein